MSEFTCRQCGVPITEDTFHGTNGLCMLCAKGVTCEVCGKRTLGHVGNLCFRCSKEQDRQRPSQIEDFILAHGAWECTVLRRLYEFDETIRREDTPGWIGLCLIDPPRDYAFVSTFISRPRVSPNNVVAFADTASDDVHFSLVKAEDGYGDFSPIVMTVPHVKENIIVGEGLHEFLCLGCTHGFSVLEDLASGGRKEVIEMLSGPPDDQEEEDRKLLEGFRDALGLKPWTNIADRLRDLDAQCQGMLEFE